MATMLEAGVPTRRGVMCAHREPAYAEGGWRCRLGPGACGCAPRTCRQLANGEHLQDQSIQLPMFDAMTRLEQERVAEALAGALREAA
jgi:dTDP-4-amino-4,6-dideoxygalactose transaminase